MNRLAVVVMLILMLLSANAWGRTTYYSYYAKDCPNGVADIIDLSQTNPFANKGKCYNIKFSNAFQILSQHVALYKIYNAHDPLALIYFGKQTAPMSFTGIVKGQGAYQYTAATGALMTVHKLAAVTRDEVAFKKHQEEIKKEEERINAEDEKQRVAEEENKRIAEAKNRKLFADKATKAANDAKYAEEIKKRRDSLDAINNKRTAIRELAELGISVDSSVVIDKKEERMWSRLIFSAQLKPARGRLKNYSLDGYSDWRLPTIEEIKNILRVNSLLTDTGVYLPSGCYWVSDTAWGSGDAHGLCLMPDDGEVRRVVHDTDCNVFPVRGGGVFSFFNKFDKSSSESKPKEIEEGI